MDKLTNEEMKILSIHTSTKQFHKFLREYYPTIDGWKRLPIKNKLPPII